MYEKHYQMPQKYIKYACNIIIIIIITTTTTIKERFHDRRNIQLDQNNLFMLNCTYKSMHMYMHIQKTKENEIE